MGLVVQPLMERMIYQGSNHDSQGDRHHQQVEQAQGYSPDAFVLLGPWVIRMCRRRIPTSAPFNPPNVQLKMG